jgi:hypothetical protein
VTLIAKWREGPSRRDKENPPEAFFDPYWDSWNFMTVKAFPSRPSKAGSILGEKVMMDIRLTPGVFFIATLGASAMAAEKKPPPISPPDKPDDQPTGPRRGAIPTPKEIIEKATPFVPDAPPPTTTPKEPKPKAR